MELWWSNTSVFLGNEHQVSRNHYVPTETQGKTIYGTTYRFQEEDAADGTSLVPSNLSKSIRQFPSSETKCSTKNTGTKVHQHDQKGKTLPQGYRHHLCAPSPSNRRRSMATRR